MRGASCDESPMHRCQHPQHRPCKADAFYRGFLGLKLAMDHGFFRTYVSSKTMTVQIGIGTKGGARADAGSFDRS